MTDILTPQSLNVVPNEHICMTSDHYTKAKSLSRDITRHLQRFPLCCPHFDWILVHTDFAMKSVTLLLAACLLAGASAKIVMIGDSFSDNGHGANPVVMDALSTPQV